MVSFWIRLPRCSEVVNNGEVESYPKRTHHLLGDHYGRVGHPLCLYLTGLRVHAGQRLAGFRPRWSPSGPVSARSPVVKGLHVPAIRPLVWPTPLA